MHAFISLSLASEVQQNQNTMKADLSAQGTNLDVEKIRYGHRVGLNPIFGLKKSIFFPLCSLR